MAARWQWGPRQARCLFASAEVLRKHLLYGPTALYYLGAMQCCGQCLSMRRLGRKLLSSNFPLFLSLADAAHSRTGIFPISPVGQA